MICLNIDRLVSETLLENSLCSAITCLFATLRLNSAQDVLDQSLVIIKKAHDQNLDTVTLSLYEAATHFVEDTIESKGENDASEQNVKSSLAANRSDGSKFLHGLILALFSSDPPSHASDADTSEALRLARTDLVSKVASQTTIGFATRETLSKIFDSWLQHERSRPLRQKIELASEKNQIAMKS